MSEIMYMPATPEEFIEDYQFVDTKEYYTNGAELISVFRVKQMLEHYYKEMWTGETAPVVHARWVHEQRYGDSGSWVWRCTACRGEAISPIISALKYCNHCGAKMDGGVADG